MGSITSYYPVEEWAVSRIAYNSRTLKPTYEVCVGHTDDWYESGVFTEWMDVDVYEKCKSREYKFDRRTGRITDKDDKDVKWITDVEGR